MANSKAADGCVPAAGARAWRGAAALLLALTVGSCGGGGGGSAPSGNGTAGVCGSGSTTPFDNLPIDMAAVTGIVPLGNLNPPAHTYPTDHNYFYLADEALPAEIYAAGDATISRIDRTEYLTGFRAGHADYGLTLEPCNEVSLSYGHVARITAALADAIGEFSVDQCQTYDTGTETVRRCSKSASAPLSSGELIGEADTVPGAGLVALDLGLRDERVNVGFVNAARHSSMTHIACPIDYFAGGVRVILEAMLGSYDGAVQRTQSPVCGEIGFDMAGTARGLWVWGSAPALSFEEAYGLALVHDNIDPSLQAISIGDLGTSLDGSVLRFTPASAGFVNRDFSQVTDDGQIYCYNPGNAILVQVLDPMTLMFEVRPGQGCAAPAFTGNALTMER